MNTKIIQLATHRRKTLLLRVITTDIGDVQWLTYIIVSNFRKEKSYGDMWDSGTYFDDMFQAIAQWKQIVSE